MKLVVNGEEREVEGGVTVASLLERLGVRAPRIAVEVNREVVRREKHGEHVLNEGDQVEIVSFVGGG